MIIKKWNTSTTAWEEQYPKTTINNIYESNGTSTFLSSNKIRASYLPDFVFGGLKFQHTITSTQVDSDSEIAAEIESVVALYGIDGAVGSYWIASDTQDWDDAGSYVSGGATNSYGWSIHAPNEEDDAGGVRVRAEAGDWIVITKIALNSGTNYDVTLGVVNNTYATASSSQRGVIKIGYTDNNKNYAVELDVNQRAYVNVPWDDTNTFRTVTAGGNTLGATETLAFTAGTNVSISESGGAVTISSTDTNYSAGNGIGLTGTTFSVAAGNGLTQEANGLAHADTSSQASSNNSGRTYIQSISVDTYGHITSLSTATETVSDTTYSAGNGISLSGTTFSVAGGQGLTQESSGLAMTYPVYHGDTLPTLTSDSSYSNVIGFEW